MSQSIQPVTARRHATKKWFNPTTYHFVAGNQFVPVSAPEIAAAGRSFLLAFAEAKPLPVLVALLGVRPGKNLFVAPNGRWMGTHLPMAFQRYPFSLVKADDGDFALHFDEASGLLKDAAAGEEGFPFFDEEGALAPHTRHVLEYIARSIKGEEVVRRATAALVQHKLLEPWPLSIQMAEGPVQIGGLRRVSEPALGALGATELAAVRDAGGLAVAYCQLFSTSNTSTLTAMEKVHREHQERERKRMAIPEHSFLPDDDNLKIDWETLLKNLES